MANPLNDDLRMDERATRPGMRAPEPRQDGLEAGTSLGVELSGLRQEQRRLALRQDDLERRLREARPEKSEKSEAKGERGKSGETADGDAKEPSAKNGAKGEGKESHADGEKSDEKEEPKPKLSERLRAAIQKHPVRAVAIGVGAVAVVVGGVLFYLHTLTYEDTDDAQIDGDISAVSTRVQGTVTGVYVIDNQPVHAGDLLADLDPRDANVARDRARAQLAQAEAQLKAEQPNVPITTVSNRTTISTSGEDVATAAAELASAEHDFDQARAQVSQAEANDHYAEIEGKRMARLASVGAVAVTQADQKTSAAEAAAAQLESQRQAAAAASKRVDEQRAKLASAQQKLEESRSNAPRQLEEREATVTLRQAAADSARADVEQADLNVSYTHIVAPVDGVVGKKSLNVGDRVEPGQQLIAITQTENLWVTANFRESQLRKMHPGQRVTVHVDAIDLDFGGQVESLPGATGSRYSLLPPENATGNFVKVVQRLPVRIKLDRGAGYERLRPGMSVEPKVTLK